MNTKLHASSIRESGFSLVELMVALVLGLILTAGVISVYTTSKKTYSLNNALGAVQESGRFAMSFIEPSVRMAGFTGCAHTTQATNRLNGSAVSFNFAQPVQGYEAVNTGIGGSYTIKTSNLGVANNAALWNPNLPSDVFQAISAYAIAGSDILLIHEASNTGLGLVSPYQDSAGFFIPPAGAASILFGEIVLVSDCTKADLFQVNQSNVSSGRIDHSQNGSLNPGNNISVWPNEKYSNGAQILAFQTYMFFIGVGADGGPSLYQVSLNTNSALGATALGTPQELVSGVENMQIVYGIDTDGDKVPNNFETADQVTNWSQVVSVRIALLTRSDDNSTDTAPSSNPKFTLLGNSSSDTTNGVTLTTLIDRRLRRTFTETISLRNELP